MRLILQLCVMVLMLFGVGNRVWGKVAVGQNIAVRGFEVGEVFCAGADEPPALVSSGEAAAWGYDVASDVRDGPNVYAYVKQNPWTGWDPHGLSVEMRTRNDKDGGKTTTIVFTASVVNKTGKDLTIKSEKLNRVLRTHDQVMEEYRANIEAGIKAQFTGQDGNHRFEIITDIRVAPDRASARKNDHIINVVNVPSSVPVLGGAAGWASNGGMTINLQEVAVMAGHSSTAGHEAGHSFGLKHPDVDGTHGGGKDPNNPIKHLGPDNFMGYGTKANKVDSRQMQIMQFFHDQGDLNGAHYKDGKWDSTKTTNQVFGTERFKSGQFPEK